MSVDPGRFDLRRRGSLVRQARRLVTRVDFLEGRLLLAADITAPMTAATVVGTLGQHDQYTTPVTVNLSATDVDNTPSQLTTFASVNGGAFVPTSSVQLTQNGTDVVRYYSQDPAGNVEAMHTLAINIDTTVPVVTASASPSSLFPPNHKLVPVTVTGHVSDASGGVPTSVTYSVVDEYGNVQPRGTAAVDANGNYAFVVSLQSSRQGQDKDGRQYTIRVSATDEAGNTGTATTFVVVPHDQGHGSGGTSQTGGDGGSKGGNHGHQGGHGHGKGHNASSQGGSSTPASQGNQGDGQGQHENNGNHGQGGDHGNAGGNGDSKGHGNGGHGKD